VNARNPGMLFVYVHVPKRFTLIILMSSFLGYQRSQLILNNQKQTNKTIQKNFLKRVTQAKPCHSAAASLKSVTIPLPD